MAALAAGGKLRHVGVTRAVQGGKYPKVHLLAILKPRAHGRYFYGAGTALGLAGTAAAAQGSVGLVRSVKTSKADQRKPLLIEGLGGTKDALRGRGESLRTKQPADLRATQAGIGAGAGGLGSLAARLALHKHPAMKPWLTPVAGGLAAAASLPVSSAVVRHRHPDYEVTPTGVRRKKDLIKKPSSQTFTARSQPRSLRSDVGKAAKDEFPNVRLVWSQQRDDDLTPSYGRGLVRDPAVGPGKYLPDIPRVEDGRNAGRKGRIVTAVIHEKKPSVGERRMGGAVASEKMPLFGGRKWAQSMQDDMEHAMDRTGHDPRPHPRQNAVPDIMRVRRQYFVRRGALGAAAVGGAVAVARARKKRVGKAQDYLGARTSYRTQRAAVTGAGGVPVIGPLAQARQAARYAPPGQETKTAVRQFGEGPAAGLAAGAGGAYAGAALAGGSAKIAGHAERLIAAKDRAANSLRRGVGLKDAVHSAPVAGTVRHAAQNHQLLKPLFATRGRAAGAAAGFIGAKSIVGLVGGQHAISASQRDQTAYNARHHIIKADVANPGTKREQHKLASTKRANAALATIGGTAGLTGLALLPTRHRAKSIYATTVGGGIGGLNALIGAKVQRKEAKRIDPLAKSLVPGRGYKPAIELSAMERRLVRLGHPHKRAIAEPVEPKASTMPRYARVDGLGVRRVIGRAGPQRIAVYDDDQHRVVHEAKVHFLKRDTVAITGSPEEHKRLIHAYGDRGPLPAGLDRDTKMKAYEARYVHAGGDKSEKWNRRANAAEGARNAALATGTSALAGLAGLKHRRAAKVIARHPRLSHRLDATALAAGAAGGAAELYGEYARHRRASYANSPGGVARSALTRMRAYTPPD